MAVQDEYILESKTQLTSEWSSRTTSGISKAINVPARESVSPAAQVNFTVA